MSPETQDIPLEGHCFQWIRAPQKKAVIFHPGHIAFSYLRRMEICEWIPSHPLDDVKTRELDSFVTNVSREIGGLRYIM